MKVGTDGVLLGAWAEGGSKILDVGTGTGLVALMMAQRFPDASVVGIDICDEAVEEAVCNVQQSPFCDRVSIKKKDFKTIECGEKYDAVVCNPPYFVNSLKCPTEGRTLARHSDTLTLEDLMKCARLVLEENGVLSIVIPYMLMDEAVACGSENGFYVKRAMKVRGNKDGEWKRALLEFDFRNKHDWTIEELTLEKERGIRTEEYNKLTEDFYL